MADVTRKQLDRLRSVSEAFKDAATVSAHQRKRLSDAEWMHAHGMTTANNWGQTLNAHLPALIDILASDH